MHFCAPISHAYPKQTLPKWHWGLKMRHLEKSLPCFALILLSQNLNYGLPWGMAFLASLSSVDCSVYHSTQRLSPWGWSWEIPLFLIILPNCSSQLLFRPALQLLSYLHQTEWLAGPLGDAQTPHHSLLFLEGFSSRISVPFSHAMSRMTLEGFTTPSNGCSNL